MPLKCRLARQVRELGLAWALACPVIVLWTKDALSRGGPTFRVEQPAGKRTMSLLSLGGARRFPSAGNEEGQQVLCLYSQP
jgi:hypothetical protein